MAQMGSNGFGIGLVTIVAAFAVWLPSSSAAKPPPKAHHWVEAFQSSPAAYGVGAPDPWARDMAGRITTITGTLRFQFPVSIGGAQIRIRFSNESGTKPLNIAAASVALSSGFEGTAYGALIPVTFGGSDGITIPAGAPATSDAIALSVKAGAQILISANLPEGIDLDSYGATGLWTAPGDQTRATAMTDAKVIIGRSVVSGVAVLPAYATPVVVTVGDSLTAGDRKTPSEWHGWPETLSKRLNTEASEGAVAIVNAAIAGNRLLSDGYGPSVLARLDRDVLRIDGLSDVVVLAGINDIGFQGRQQFGITQPDIRAGDLIAAYRQIIARVHARGARVIGGTLLPFEGAFYYTPAKDQMRQYVNNWIRTSGAFDAVIDFDAVMRDPANPLTLRPEFDSGDHLHPNLAGEKAMGEAIDLKP